MTRPTNAGDTAPALRRDAARNRDRVLAAAGAVFGEHGLDASVADVARVAGVGMGTVYRRFPTKDALIEALVQKVLDAAIGLALEAASHPNGTGLEWFLEALSGYQADHLGCLPRLWNTDHEKVRTARRLIAELLADAQANGRMRSDLTSTDISMIMFAIRGILEATKVHAPDAWRRHLELLIAGTRPAPEPLRHPPVSRARLDRLLSTPR